MDISAAWERRRSEKRGKQSQATTFMAFILLALATRAPPVPSLKLILGRRDQRLRCFLDLWADSRPSILKVLSASSKGNSETQRPWNILTASTSGFFRLRLPLCWCSRGMASVVSGGSHHEAQCSKAVRDYGQTSKVASHSSQQSRISTNHSMAGHA